MGNPNEYDLGGNTLIVKDIKVGATKPGQAGTSISSSELGVIDGVTAGTASASKAVVLDSSKNVTGVGTADVTGLGVGKAAGTTNFVAIAAGTTAKAQINLAASTAPTAPADGDIWFEAGGLKIRIGGVTKTVTVA